MRKIVFRIKDIDIWYYGFPLREVRHEDLYIPFQGEDENGNSFYSISVDVKTLGQFTGLCDKNGKEIYEGDIVHCWDTIAKCEIWAVVEFGNPNAEYTWGWQLRKINGSKGVNLDILCWVECEETNAYCEIIGNIYDNPELLKGE